MEDKQDKTQETNNSLVNIFYTESLTIDEIKEAENNLYGFIKTLIQIDQRIKSEEQTNDTRDN